MDLSPTTQSEYYSGDWQSIRNICRVLKMGEGRLAKITQELVNFYQEMVDREIDGELTQYYYIPIRGYNVWMPDANSGAGATVKVFPGNIRTIARYWTAGLLLTSEFQGLDPNTNESANNYIIDSKQKIFDIIKFSRRIPGARWKSRQRPMPPTLDPGYLPELNT